MHQFGECVSTANWFEFNCAGDRFTWERGLLREKIDWVFANEEWINDFRTAKAFHLPKFGSDHRPILVIACPNPDRARSTRSFKCQAA